jgi:hypothetical protein
MPRTVKRPAVCAQSKGEELLWLYINEQGDLEDMDNQQIFAHVDALCRLHPKNARTIGSCRVIKRLLRRRDYFRAHPETSLTIGSPVEFLAFYEDVSPNPEWLPGVLTGGIRNLAKGSDGGHAVVKCDETGHLYTLPWKKVRRPRHEDLYSW